MVAAMRPNKYAEWLSISDPGDCLVDNPIQHWLLDDGSIHACHEWQLTSLAVVQRQTSMEAPVPAVQGRPRGQLNRQIDNKWRTLPFPRHLSHNQVYSFRFFETPNKKGIP